jgi:DNA-binding NtrC family response regulator
MTAYYSTETAVEAIRKGASDYINKPLDIEALSDKVGKLVQEARQRKHALDLDREMVSAYEFHGIVSRSPLMLDRFALIRRIAPHFRTVLVTGSTGTGKELVARALHKLSPAASGPFVVCNCSAIVETLFESELFGYVKGAFTGAAHDKTGLFETANGGVIFLDEIGEMPLTAQAKLLRAVQHQEISPVGSPAVRKLNVRVVAATNRDLGAMAARREFRDDLYYRLSMVEINVPDLADRREDLPLLERFYLERFSTEYGKTIAGITARAQMVLARHTWPGNVRELENVLGYACMMNETATVDVADLPSYLRGMVPGGEVADPEMVSLDVMARRHTRRVLELVHGNKARAADVLGVSRATLYRLLADESRRKSTA